MATRTYHVRPLPDGTFALLNAKGCTLEVHETAEAASRATALDRTPEERAARFGGFSGDGQALRDATLVARLDAGLPLSKVDARDARRLKRQTLKGA